MKNTLILFLVIIPLNLLSQKYSVQLYEPSLIKEDIDTLIGTLKKVHPIFNEYYDKYKIDKKIESIKNKIVEPTSSLELFRLMQPLISIDGHTTLMYSGEVYPDLEEPFFPFKIIIYNKKLYIKENLSDNKTIKKASIIQSLNGLSTDSIISNLTRYIPGELERYKLKKLEKQFHIFYRLVYGSFSEFIINVNGSEVKVNGVSESVFQEPPKPKFELRFYDTDIAYIYKRSFKPPKAFLHFMDSAFTEISNRDIKYLIIDNLEGGGLTDLADSLMTYFTYKQYKLFEKREVKISSFTKNYIEQIKSNGYMDNQYFIQEYSLHNTGHRNIFEGQTYIMVGPLSYSTGTCFPAAAKCYKTATIIGEETGQPLISNGDLNRFFLKNTKLPCYTSLAKYYMTCNNGIDQKGVIPDYKVTPSLDDLLYDKDYILDFTLEMIRVNKGKGKNKRR